MRWLRQISQLESLRRYALRGLRRSGPQGPERQSALGDTPCDGFVLDELGQSIVPPLASEPALLVPTKGTVRTQVATTAIDRDIAGAQPPRDRERSCWVPCPDSSAEPIVTVIG